MKTQSPSRRFDGTKVEPRAKRLMTPRSRFFAWYACSLIMLGPLGFVVGPLGASYMTGRAERAYPQEAYAARQRDVGFNVGQWWIMGLLTLLGGIGTLVLLQALPMLALVLWAQLANG
ncbi:hypothetical protein ACPEH1_03500 [Stenotrophomonas sp. NPDC077421]|jgi:hypothetical protein|uniref:hypothetical protein n=2 Tax=Lysobacteraceae TaxID=32033 RepID=UPI0012917869